MGYVLNVKDVLSDAHNTFIRSTEDKDSEQEMQLEDILKRDRTFNWSDDDFNSLETTNNETVQVVDPAPNSALPHNRKSKIKQQQDVISTGTRLS